MFHVPARSVSKPPFLIAGSEVAQAEAVTGRVEDTRVVAGRGVLARAEDVAGGGVLARAEDVVGGGVLARADEEAAVCCHGQLLSTE